MRYLITTLTLAMLNTAVAADSNAALPQEVNSTTEASWIDLLKVPDTTSPRTTLQSFLTDIRIVIAENRDRPEVISHKGYLAYVRLLRTMDFSTTPDGHSEIIMRRHARMLYEILVRIDIPPFHEIPGKEAVTDKAFDTWTLPHTKLIIQRVSQGPHAGEYLFSAATVQRLPRYFRKIKHLPYKSEFISEREKTYLETTKTDSDFELEVRNRLKPVDVSNPRSTLEGFLDSVNRAYALIMETEAALMANPPTMTNEEAAVTETRARNLMRRAMSTLDLSKVPKSIREDVGLESALLLKEVFDRMRLPVLQIIPDLAMIRSERKQHNRPLEWRYPNTEIEIVEIQQGERQGQFLFSAKTISHINQYYQEIEDLPYRVDTSSIALEYLSPELSEGFYNKYISAPNHLIHQHTLLGRFVKHLPDVLKQVYGGQTTWQWIALGFCLPLTLLILLLIHNRLLGHVEKYSDAGRNWRRFIFTIVTLMIIWVLSEVLDNQVNLTGNVLYISIRVLDTISWFFLAATFFFFGCAIAESIIASPKIDPEGIKASYLRALFGVLGFTVAALIMLYGLAHVGISLMPMLAGVGIGGLAIALAARPTLESVISSFIIFADKPYRVGQRVNVMGQDGTVESIGLRSTKIRLLTGHLTSIPNEKMAACEIENIGRRPYIRRLMDVTITYDTPPEKISRAIEILKDILAVPEGQESVSDSESEGQSEPHRNEAINQPDFPPRVSFNDLNADSLNIRVIYWYHPAQYWDFLDHSTWVNLQIMERFNAEGIDFAFPTQTLHLAGDEKRAPIGHQMIENPATE